VSRLARVAVGSAGASLLVAACLPAAATAEGREISTLYGYFMLLAVLVGLLVFGLATFAIVRYRVPARRGRTARDRATDAVLEDEPLPAQTHGNLKLEAVWTAIPLLTVIGLFAGTLVVLNRVEARSAQPAAEIRVEAFRWGWTFRYPNEGVEVSGIGAPGPEVVVPVGEPLRFTLTAADVNHAFFVPQFLFKRDMIPGRDNVFEITIEEAAAYGGQCAEFCGIYHAKMPFTIRAVPRAEYDAWLAGQPREGAQPSAAPGGPAAPGPAASAAASDGGQPLEPIP
jgi:cytochrome c oxidase subunit 2